ncbi:MAG: PEP/pyruvate-binding domain-containing protein [Candidatus Velthaea sp.]
MTKADRLIAWFDEIDEDEREAVGGKALSLGRLRRAGIRVPPGFVVTTRAFSRAQRSFDPDGALRAAIANLPAQDREACARAGAAAHDAVLQAELSAEVTTAIAESYSRLCDACGEDVPVAVRSSATAEDSADSSFAGLQDTLLWVRGERAVDEAVRRCWASLYSEPCVVYRRRLGLPEERMAMGVAVQQMVRARSAGVMFTRSPLTGDRSIVAINASWGLGSAVVGGEVTPDEFVVDKISGDLRRTRIGEKAIRHVPAETFGTRVEDVPEALRVQPSLAPEELRELVAIGRRVEAHYGHPQDIEWAIDERGEHPENIFLLQSRPETVWSARESVAHEVPREKAFEHVLSIFGSAVRR